MNVNRGRFGQLLEGFSGGKIIIAGGIMMEESAILANYAAGIAAGKVGTAAVSRSELESDFESRQ